MAAVTPALAAAGPHVLYGVLTVLVALGMLIAYFTFRTRHSHYGTHSPRAARSGSSTAF